MGKKKHERQKRESKRQPPKRRSRKAKMRENSDKEIGIETLRDRNRDSERKQQQSMTVLK